MAASYDPVGDEVHVTTDEAPILDLIIAFEEGDLDEDGVIALFQRLVDNGMAWSLQGSYGRTAIALIDAGLVAAST